MTLENEMNDIAAKTDSARTEAIAAFTSLNNEANKDDPDADELVKQAAKVWTASTRFWAELWLAPQKMATELAKKPNGS